jgi:hypothetical protein
MAPSVVNELVAFQDLGRVYAAEDGARPAHAFAGAWRLRPDGLTVDEADAWLSFSMGYESAEPLLHNPEPLGSGGRFRRCVEAVAGKGSAYDPAAVCAAAGRRKYGAAKFAQMAAVGRRRRNPLESAARLYEEFHGKPSTEVVDVQESLHVHDNLAELGKLLKLQVTALDSARVTLSGFEGALLCSNEDGSQLFIRGGDQFVDLDVFDITEPHENETLGTVKRIWYFTEKLHLGKEGGRSKYFHDFGEEAGRRPHLIYHYKDPSLEFSGGSYVVEREGVRN